MIKFNKILWWIPFIGIVYTFFLGFKYGFFVELSNPLKLWEGIIGGLIHVVFFYTSIYIIRKKKLKNINEIN